MRSRREKYNEFWARSGLEAGQQSPVRSWSIFIIGDGGCSDLRDKKTVCGHQLSNPTPRPTPRLSFINWGWPQPVPVASMNPDPPASQNYANLAQWHDSLPRYHFKWWGGKHQIVAHHDTNAKQIKRQINGELDPKIKWFRLIIMWIKCKYRTRRRWRSRLSTPDSTESRVRTMNNMEDVTRFFMSSRKHASIMKISSNWIQLSVSGYNVILGMSV